LSEQRLQLALAVGKLGSWQLTFPERTLVASPQCKANHGLPPDASISLESITDAVAPAHRDRFRRTIERAIDTHGSFELEVPNRWPDGTDHWLVLCGSMVDDSSMVGVSQDATARHRIEEALLEADRRKDDFLALLGHELRNPLSCILAGARLLQVKGPPDPVLVKARDAILRQARQLTRLVDDLLDVGRITAGKLRLEKERVELGAILTQAIESCTPLIERHGHHLAVSRAETPIWLEADPVRLVQIVCNLLNNAAKYMHDGGSIRLDASVTDRWALISVRDQGFGIPKEMLGRIFQRFVQVESTHQRAEGGLGIGLSLVKSIVEMHGGSVEARSAGAGKGSEFVVRLPVLEEARTPLQRPSFAFVPRRPETRDGA
jgi:signal transduction histidine kinase